MGKMTATIGAMRPPGTRTAPAQVGSRRAPHSPASRPPTPRDLPPDPLTPAPIPTPNLPTTHPCIPTCPCIPSPTCPCDPADLLLCPQSTSATPPRSSCAAVGAVWPRRCSAMARMTAVTALMSAAATSMSVSAINSAAAARTVRTSRLASRCAPPRVGASTPPNRRSSFLHSVPSICSTRAYQCLLCPAMLWALGPHQ